MAAGAGGFKVELYAAGLINPREMRTAPNGDIFLAETRSRRDQDIPRHHRGRQTRGDFRLRTGLRAPFGIAFYPPGPNPSGFISATRLRWCASLIRTAI